ncbi:MAG: 16S rRNA (guanine(527)-N(7))-methyltransferase RsmG [Chitinophagaceae bacterium]|nr:16S rRNA (guanine(527)-N(7))-methyltransferase RsmG [Chitinophagaceae bacterium]
MELIKHYFNDFSELQLKQFAAMEALYKNWNSKINVISRKDEDGLYEKHVLHSLSIAAVFDLKKGMNVLDLGTGGGFPGIPLAIFFPEVNFYLADSIGKKIKVVEAVADGLGLKNITAAHIRAEEIRGKKFDTVVSRAVAPLEELLKWSKLLLVPKSRFLMNAEDKDALPVPHGLICLKGGDLSAEIAASGVKPKLIEISELFREDYFKGKYILYAS